MLFYVIVTLVILQRLIEVLVAKRNEQMMLSKGAYEVGASHYPFMILLHSSFFISLILEVLLFNKSISPIFPLIFILFLLVQFVRVWCLTTLGEFWNTKIIILPGANVVRKGPYLYFRHPNYVVVCSEIILLPLMFNSFFTAIAFSLLNIILLSVRIPIEEKALMEATNYTHEFKKKLTVDS
nr:isoprenylcysteine carboxylmethyltransferase family protein [Lysinibacillus timonensis]